MSNDGALPQDILANILHRLPLKSLCRIKCVSPSWNSLISSPHFAKTHLNRTEAKNPKCPQQKIIIFSRCGNLYSIDFANGNPTAAKLEFPTLEHEHAVEKWVHIWSSYDGLLVVSTVDKSVLLSNPSTREVKKLPMPTFLLEQNSWDFIVWDSFGVGFDSSTHDYKVLIIAYCRNYSESSTWSYTTIVAVYSLKTNAWRRLRDFQYYGFRVGSSGRLLVRTPDNSGVVFLNGYFHCLCRNSNHEKLIVAFDWSDEIYREVLLPASIHEFKMRSYHLAVLGGCLCLVHDEERWVWMMKEYGVRESWTKFTMCSGSSGFHVVGLVSENEFLLLGMCTDGEMKMVVYNPQKDTKKEMVICGIPAEFRFEGTYVESVVSPHYGGGIGWE